MSETSVPKVYQAIANITGAMSKEGIGKNRKNLQQGYQFRGIDDVYNALASELAKNKLCILPVVIDREVVERTTQKGGNIFYVTLKVRFDFVSAEDGSKHEITTIGEAMDSGDKATNKAMSAAYKYAALMTFCIPTEGDNDSENQTHEIKPEPAKPKTDKPAKPPTQEVLTVHGIIEEVSAKEGEKNGKPWKRYGVRIGDVWFGTFSATVGEAAESCKGAEVAISYTSGEHNTIVELVPVAA
jgi:hypothetical protein